MECQSPLKVGNIDNFIQPCQRSDNHTAILERTAALVSSLHLFILYAIKTNALTDGNELPKELLGIRKILSTVVLESIAALRSIAASDSIAAPDSIAALRSIAATDSITTSEINTTSENIPALESIAALESVAALKSITGSDSIASSDGITTSDSTAGSDNIASSDGITISDGITTSDGTADSDNIASSDGITTSDGTAGSDNITGSDGVTTSDGTTGSDNVASSDGITTSDSIDKDSSPFSDWIKDPNSFWETSTEFVSSEEWQSNPKKLRAFLEHAIKREAEREMQNFQRRFHSVLVFLSYVRSQSLTRIEKKRVEAFLQEVGLPTEHEEVCSDIIRGGRNRLVFCYELQSGKTKIDSDVLSLDIDYSPLFRSEIPDQIWEQRSGYFGRQRKHWISEMQSQDIKNWSAGTRAPLAARAIISSSQTLIWASDSMEFPRSQQQNNDTSKQNRPTKRDLGQDSQTNVGAGRKRRRGPSLNNICDSSPVLRAESAIENAEPTLRWHDQRPQPQTVEDEDSPSVVPEFQPGREEATSKRLRTTSFNGDSTVVNISTGMHPSVLNATSPGLQHHMLSTNCTLTGGFQHGVSDGQDSQEAFLALHGLAQVATKHLEPLANTIYPTLNSTLLPGNAIIWDEEIFEPVENAVYPTLNSSLLPSNATIWDKEIFEPIENAVYPTLNSSLLPSNATIWDEQSCLNRTLVVDSGTSVNDWWEQI